MPLHIAFVLSLACHLALYTLADWAGLRAPPPPAPRPLIEAMLILPEIAEPSPAAPAPEEAPPVVETPRAEPPLPDLAPPLPAAVVAPAAPQAALKPAATRTPPRFYPREAVLRGLEGEALVGVTLDARGRVIAARLERGSGHAILDEAAVMAARTLTSLPRGEREATLPVRFRLN